MLKRLLSDSVSLVFGNLEVVFKVCGAWFAVLLVVFGTVDPSNFQAGSASGLAPFLKLAVYLVATASITVAWHRFGLLNERPSKIHLRFGSLEGLLIVKSLVVILVIMAYVSVFFLIFLLFPSFGNPEVLGPIAAVVAAPVYFRLMLVFPATAVGHPIGFKEAFRIGKGLGWRMFIASFVLSIPFELVSKALIYVLELSEGGLPIILIQMKVLVLNVLSQIITMILSISVLTTGFRIAMEREAAATAV